MRDVWIRGVGMTRFGRHLGRSARDLAEEAVLAALRDADLEPHDVHAAFVGNAADGLMSGQESIRAQVILRRTGLMGVPMINVENGCASGSTALHVAWQAVASGAHDCVLVLGWEKLCHDDRSRPLLALNASTDLGELAEVFGQDPRPERSAYADLYASFASGDGQDRFSREDLALVSVKNHQHGALNPCARYPQPVTVEEVLGARSEAGLLTALMCAQLSDGAAALLLCATSPPVGARTGVRIAASVLASGRGDDLRRPTGVQRAVRQAAEEAGAGMEDMDVVELHDGTAVAELALYEELGICPPGDAERLLRDRVTWLGGRLPVNTSGGLLARGHPMGATGAAQVIELVWQLQGRCGRRQVPGARMALAHNYGGWVGTDAAACSVHILQG
ncbi:MAG TPA: beta-ketoacyl synthase N-terminal-like domain-containing protein [Candidatus Dormibacteraeota bacterium]|nr:beta-ketoacyl synthase N-terminal-like domain-containing protein [Candidatus Dormibacteraeota bacterium]